MQENITEETLAEDYDVESADGDEAVDTVTDTSEIVEETITLADIEKELGKKFPDKATALKSWKDTNSYVGKKLEENVTPEVDSEKFVSKEKYEEDMWFKEHADLDEHRDLILALKKDGKSYDDVLETPSLKSLLDAKRTVTEADNKSVIHGNSRIAKSSDYESDKAEAQRTGDWTAFLSKHKGLAVPE